MRYGFQIWPAIMKWKPAATFFHKKDGQGIVYVFEIGPFVNPLFVLGVFRQLAWETEAIDLLW